MEKGFKFIETTKVIDENGKERNVAGLLKQYVYNKIDSEMLDCTWRQYDKFLELLGNLEEKINEL